MFWSKEELQADTQTISPNLSELYSVRVMESRGVLGVQSPSSSTFFVGKLVPSAAILGFGQNATSN